MLARGILGRGRTHGVSFRPFPNSSGWWWLISSIFLIRTSCHKTTHANGYYGAWPGWAVSISMLPLTPAVQGTLKSLLQHHSSKASILQRSAFFTVHLSHPYMTTGKTIALYIIAAKSLQLCLTLCDPIDGSPPGSPVPGILQARTLEWVAISFSNA